MEPVESWFGPFVARHRARFHRDDWPSPKTDAGRIFYDGWRHAFAEKRITAAAAERASLEMICDPPRFPDGHASAIVARALAIQGRQQSAAPALPAPEDDSPGRRAALEGLRSLLASSRDGRGRIGRGPRRIALAPPRDVLDHLEKLRQAEAADRERRTAPPPDLIIPEDDLNVWF